MNWLWAVKSYFFPPSPEYEKPWRSMDWSESNKNTLLQTLIKLKPWNSEVDSLRILLHGPIGAGKSSLINSVDSVLQRHITSRALANSANELGKSFTLESKTYKLRDKTGSVYPFTLTDICGIEKEEGIQIDDIIKILGGHIQNGYSFNQAKPISEDDPKYMRNPNLKDKIHCLVSVLPADSISMMEEDVINKIIDVRKKARDLGIPQAVIMTRIDEACPLVKENLQKVHTSKKIKEKMETCSVKLGVPVSYIYPVKNYHEEDNINTKTDVLILHALQNIVNFANDYVRDQEDNELTHN